MESEKITFEYPVHIPARLLHICLQRNMPCIVYFEYKAEPISDSISKNIKLFNKRYPNVFCYKVGWDSHQKYFQKFIPSNVHDVTVWKNGKKIMLSNIPSLENLEYIFSYVDNQIKKVDKIVFDDILKEDIKRYMQNTNRRNSVIKYRKRINLSGKIELSDICVKIDDKNSKIIKTDVSTIKGGKSNHIQKQNSFLDNKLNIKRIENINYVSALPLKIKKIDYKNYSDEEMLIAESLILLSRGSHQTIKNIKEKYNEKFLCSSELNSNIDSKSYDMNSSIIEKEYINYKKQYKSFKTYFT